MIKGVLVNIELLVWSEVNLQLLTIVLKGEFVNMKLQMWSWVNIPQLTVVLKNILVAKAAL